MNQRVGTDVSIHNIEVDKNPEIVEKWYPFQTKVAPLNSTADRMEPVKGDVHCWKDKEGTINYRVRVHEEDLNKLSPKSLNKLQSEVLKVFLSQQNQEQ